MNERIVNLPGAYVPMAKARGLQAQTLVTTISRYRDIVKDVFLYKSLNSVHTK